MPSNTGYDVRGALNSVLRSSFGDDAFVNGKYSAQAAVNSILRNQFGDEAFPGGQYSAQAALTGLLRDQFGDEAFPGDDPQPGGPPPPRIPDVAPPLDEEEGPPVNPANFDPGTFGPDFNVLNGRPGAFGDTFNRPAPAPDPATVTDPNEGRSYRIPGFGNPAPGPQSAGGRSPTASAPLPGSTPQRTLFANTPPANRFGTGGAAGSASRINGGSTRLRKFLGA